MSATRPSRRGNPRLGTLFLALAVAFAGVAYAAARAGEWVIVFAAAAIGAWLLTTAFRLIVRR